MAPEKSLGGAAARGAATVFSAQLTRVGIQVLGVAVLARLLTPTDYGLLAMAMVVISFADTFRDFGFSAAAIQAKSLSAAQRGNLFWANTGIGALLTLTIWVTAGLVAEAFGEPDLRDLMLVLGPVFIFNGAATQYRASLARAMRFGSVAWTEVLGAVVGLAVGMTAALSGWEYWSLAAMQLTTAFVVLAVLILRSGWLPTWPRRGQDMGPLLRFGSFLVGSQVVTFLSNNIDTMVLGRRFSADTVGLYDRPYRLLMLPLAQIRAPSTTVALPVLSRLQDDDAGYARILLRGQLALGYGLVLPLGFVAGAAVPVVAVFLGDGWTESVPVLALLAVSAGFRTLAFVGYWVYLSKGLTRSLMYFSAFDAAVKIGLVLAMSSWGLVGVAGAVALTPALTWVVSLVWLSRLTVIPLRGLVTGGARVALLAAVVGGVAYGTDALLGASLAPVTVLAAAVTACTAVIGVVMVLVGPVRRDLLSLRPALVAAIRRRESPRV